MKIRNTMIILVALILLMNGCYYYKHFQIKNLKSNKAMVLWNEKPLIKGNYVVTPGYVKLYKAVYKEKHLGASDDECEAMTRRLLVAEYLNGNFEVRARMVEEVESYKKNKKNM